MAYITTEQVREIREQLKTLFPRERGWKFSVVRKDATSVDISIMEAPFDLADGKKFHQVNHHHLDIYDEKTALVLKTITKVITKDYQVYSDEFGIFDVAFYFDIYVGKWETPFVVSPVKKKWTDVDTLKGLSMYVLKTEPTNHHEA